MKLKFKKIEINLDQMSTLLKIELKTMKKLKLNLERIAKEIEIIKILVKFQILKIIFKDKVCLNAISA